MGWSWRQNQILSRPLSSEKLFYKAIHFTENIEKYDAVFLGDSKSFCAMHPEKIDKILGLKSYNLSHWSNWFPTQYALTNDLINILPDGFTVIWSIGHINFDDNNIRPIYPIGTSRVLELVGLGYSIQELLMTE